MAKRKSSGSGLANFLGGVAMRAVASKMEQKYHYAERGKINPYSAAALGISTGRMKSAKDVARTGAVLGALGAFDDDAPKTRAPFPARGYSAPSGGASTSARSDLALPAAPGRRAPAPDRPAASA